AGVASTNFTVRHTGRLASSVIVTPTPITGVTFTPSSVTFAANVFNPTATFTVTKAAEGIIDIVLTSNAAGWTNPIAHEFSTKTWIPGGMDNLILTQKFTNPSWSKQGSIALSNYVDAADGLTYTRVQMQGTYTSKLVYDVVDHASGYMQIKIKTLGSANQYIGLYGGADNDLNFDGTLPKNTWTLCSAVCGLNLDFNMHNRGGDTDFLIQQAKVNAGALTTYALEGAGAAFSPEQVTQVVRYFDFADGAQQTVVSSRVTAVNDLNGLSDMYTDHGPRVISTSNFGTNRAAVEMANGDILGSGVAGTYGRLFVDLDEISGATDYSFIWTFSLEASRPDYGRLLSLAGGNQDYNSDGNLFVYAPGGTLNVALNSNLRTSGATTFTTNTPYLLEVRVRSNSGQFYRNGVAIGVAVSIGAALQASATLCLCRQANTDIDLSFGQVRSLTVASGIPSASDQEKLEGFAAWHATGNGNLLPVGHAYKNAAP
ncbi:MAG: hypothetical protein H0W34_01040, partial [Pyrinomonadaceae bacterium]|nr:hypothetical protein [Pyrinomonadaceae bacterium]